MAIPDATLELIATYVTTLGTWVSLHTDDPGVDGSNEATGSPYARVQTTWSSDADVDGVRTGTVVNIDVPAGEYTHFGLWTASTGGTFRGGAELANPTEFASDDVLAVTPVVTVIDGV